MGQVKAWKGVGVGGVRRVMEGAWVKEGVVMLVVVHLVMVVGLRVEVAVGEIYGGCRDSGGGGVHWRV